MPEVELRAEVVAPEAHRRNDEIRPRDGPPLHGAAPYRLACVPSVAPLLAWRRGLAARGPGDRRRRCGRISRSVRRSPAGRRRRAALRVRARPSEPRSACGRRRSRDRHRCRRPAECGRGEGVGGRPRPSGAAGSTGSSISSAGGVEGRPSRRRRSRTGTSSSRCWSEPFRTRHRRSRRTCSRAVAAGSSSSRPARPRHPPTRTRSTQRARPPPRRGRLRSRIGSGGRVRRRTSSSWGRS